MVLQDLCHVVNISRTGSFRSLRDPGKCLVLVIGNLCNNFIQHLPIGGERCCVENGGVGVDVSLSQLRPAKQPPLSHVAMNPWFGNALASLPRDRETGNDQEGIHLGIFETWSIHGTNDETWPASDGSYSELLHTTLLLTFSALELNLCLHSAYQKRLDPSTDFEDVSDIATTSGQRPAMSGTGGTWTSIDKAS